MKYFYIPGYKWKIISEKLTTTSPVSSYVNNDITLTVLINKEKDFRFIQSLFNNNGEVIPYGFIIDDESTHNYNPKMFNIWINEYKTRDLDYSESEYDLEVSFICPFFEMDTFTFEDVKSLLTWKGKLINKLNEKYN